MRPMSNKFAQATDSLAKLRSRVRCGVLSPMEALDRITLAQRAGHIVSPALIAWIYRRIRANQSRYGTHGHLRRG